MAIVRLSGPESWSIARTISEPSSSTEPVTKAFRTVHRTYRHGDDGLVVLFPQGRSYTGEACAELSCHGSRAAVQELLEACLSQGARMADPGEFTYRAFMNSRIDLTQAEGVRDTVSALTATQLRQANRLRDGALRESVCRLRDDVHSVLAAVEASTDFSEEVGDLDRPAALARLRSVASGIEDLLEGTQRSWLLREGLTVAIIGRPNVGKSSLLNLFLGSERAIVTDIPGTTRDTVEEVCNVRGVSVRFVDTAGLRTATDQVEAIGVRRAWASGETADHVLYVYAGPEGWTEEDEASLSAVPARVTVVENKSDLDPPRRRYGPAVRVSAKTGEGVTELMDNLVQELTDGEPPLPNRRHTPLLEAALADVEEASRTMIAPVPDDLAAVHLRAASRVLGEVTGETASPDIIDRVFHDFCIGK